MSEPRQGEPEWSESDKWNEFEWEQALKHSDHVAGRYFRMLERFGDLPNAEEFISEHLGEQNFFEFQDDTFYPYGDDEEAEAEWNAAEAAREGLNQEGDDDDDEDEALEEEAQIGLGDSLYFETCPVYQRARQIALGWCNILSSVLKPEDRIWGMSILFHLGRILSYLAISIGDGTFERLPASIAFAKRALYEVNLVLGEIDSHAKANTSYRTIFKLIREHLLETHDMLVTLLFDLRKRSKEDRADT